jgi:pimeloyl-ACP methyl ester carboxylesterase
MPEISNSISSRIHYRKTGAGPALVLLHGFPERSELWQGIEEHLSQSFTIIMPDFPGSGGSILERPTSIVEMAECVKDVIDAEGIGKAVIAGHSMGGYVALAFAAAYPGKVAGLSLVHSTASPDDEEKKENRRKSIALIQKGGRNAFINQMIPNLFSEPFKRSHPQVVESCIDMAQTVEDKSLVNYLDAMRSRPGRQEQLKTAAFPLQWIAGKNDNIISYKKILEQCHQSHVNFVYLYDDCGHMGMFEAPEKLVADLKEFVLYAFTPSRMN